MLSFLSIMYMLAPIYMLVIFYFIFRNKSETTKYRAGVVIALLAILILIIRNIEILVNEKFLHPEAIPLQICHFANIALVLSLIFKNKKALAITFTIHLPFAFISHFVGQHYFESWESFFTIGAQAYIWGHLLIVLGSAFPIMFKTNNYSISDLKKGLKVIILIFAFAMICNVLFVGLGFDVNYFYTHRAHGLPGFFKSLENVGPIIRFPYYDSELDVKLSTPSNFYLDLFFTSFMLLVGFTTVFLMHKLKKFIDKKSLKTTS